MCAFPKTRSLIKPIWGGINAGGKKMEIAGIYLHIEPGKAS